MANQEVGAAYVTIYPKMAGDFSQTIGREIGEASSASASRAGVGGIAIGNALGSAITGAVGSAVGAIGDVVGDAFRGYADYEQLVGGVDKLFGESSGKLQAYAEQAYRTAGMSANQYMEQATSFSASLISSLGGDTARAADMADVAMRSMSDNVNTFGTDMGSVQYAYQGFAKQNYTMLDNLKLGYGGTKEEMERLIEDANAYAEAIGEAGGMSIDSFADVVRAIDLVQQRQGIAGTTAKESAATIEGSMATAQASWENLLASMGRGPGEVQRAFATLMASLQTLGQNVLGYASTALQSVFESVAGSLGASRDDIQGFYAWIERTWESISGNLAPAFAALGESLGALGQAMAPIASQMAPVLLAALGGIADFASAIVGAIALAIANIVQFSADVVSAAKGVGDGVQSAFAVIPNAVAAVKRAWSDVQRAASSAWRSIWNTVSSTARNLVGAVQRPMQSIRSAVSTIWGGIRGSISSAVGSIKSVISGISSIVGSVRSTFNAARDAMLSPFNAARDAIRGVVDRIRGMFPIHLGDIFSGLRVPTISVDGGEAPWGIGGRGRPPSFSWYAQGGFVDGPTIIGAGERGPEMILPESGGLMDRFSEAVASKIGGNQIYITLNYSADADADRMVRDIAHGLGRRLAMEG